MLQNYYIERINSPTDPRLEYAYESLLRPNFSPGEIEPIEKLRSLIEKTASKAAKNPLVLMVAYNNHNNNPESLISGNILDFGEVGCGAIGYTVTKTGYRRKGLASSLVGAFEKQIHENFEKPKLVIIEMRRGSKGFWDKVGYGHVQDRRKNVEYYQPPMDFNFKTGEPLYGEVRETLMAKFLNGEKDREEFRKWLMRSVEEVSKEWYAPEAARFKTEGAHQNALDYTRKVVQTNLHSIRNATKLRLPNYRMR
jgi:hypothetical protein